ncbi:YybH family protein [Flavobacterium sp.]|uniref:YybH family protein n=1 Tax=Flavobacterium sp. TaxID=239 RepID=UPI003D6AF532
MTISQKTNQFILIMKNSFLKYSFFIFLLISCNDKPTFEEAKAKIKAQNEKLHQVIATKNTALLEDVYAKDANFLSPGSGIVKGRDSIISLWKSGLDNMVEMHSKTIDINGTPDVVYEVGIVETKIKANIKTKDTFFIYKAKYSNVWRRDEKGDYRLTVDIWNDFN